MAYRSLIGVGLLQKPCPQGSITPAAPRRDSATPSESPAKICAFASCRTKRSAFGSAQSPENSLSVLQAFEARDTVRDPGALHANSSWTTSSKLWHLATQSFETSKWLAAMLAASFKSACLRFEQPPSCAATIIPTIQKKAIKSRRGHEEAEV